MEFHGQSPISRNDFLTVVAQRRTALPQSILLISVACVVFGGFKALLILKFVCSMYCVVLSFFQTCVLVGDNLCTT